MTNKNSKLEYEKMLNKLNELYDIQEKHRKDVTILIEQLNQVNEDIELLETMIMYQYNKEARRNVRR